MNFLKWLKNKKAKEPESTNMTDDIQEEAPEKLKKNQKEFGASIKGRKFLGIVEANIVRVNKIDEPLREEMQKKLIRLTVDGKEATDNETIEFNRHLVKECLV